METESRKVLGKLCADFIELIHGYGCHSCAKISFSFCRRLGIVCAHVCVDTGVPWFCAVLHTAPPPPRHTHTGPCRGLCIIFLSPVRFYKSPQPLRSNLRKHFLCIGFHYEHFTNMNLLSSHKILKGRYYYHPHFTDEDPETKRG